MPTYEYACPAGHEFELFQKMSDKPRAKCPVCGKPATRQISGGAGLVFKGSGFYITDYGKDGKGPRKAESGSESSEAPAAKPEKSDQPTAATGSEKSDPAPKAEKPAPAAESSKPKAEKPGVASKSARKKARPS